jgi:CRP-like cAMP-binding protein
MADFFTQNLVHLAAILTMVCFLFRDQIKLRAFAAAGDLVLSAYYFFAFSEPLWNALFWSLANVVINAVMILVLLREHRMSLLSDNEMMLFRSLDTLTPGQFRKLLKQADWHEGGETPATLTRQGEKPERLYYVLQGEVTIDKDGRALKADPRLFIGEVAFLRGRQASATVTAPPGALYVSWQVDRLEALLRRNEELKNALARLLSADMAEKVARA